MEQQDPISAFGEQLTRNFKKNAGVSLTQLACRVDVDSKTNSEDVSLCSTIEASKAALGVFKEFQTLLKPV